MKYLAAFLLTILFSIYSLCADTVTLKVAFSGALPKSDTLQIPSNVVASVVHSVFRSANLWVSFPGATNAILGGTGSIFTGPATITLTNTGNDSPSICTIQTSPATTPSFAPSSAVVIPNDNGGPVTIILESSTDLVTWTAASPGTYGTSSSNRFFRVRAER